MSYTLLTIIASAQLGRIPTGPDATFPQWNGPDPAVVHVQSILYASLSASLLAAFVAMLGKQWLNRFSRADIRGSIAERSRDRVRKSKGMETWRFDLVMELLPIMLQLALFLLGYALSNYLFLLNRTVAAVVIGFTTFGLLFFVLIVSAATLSYTCPFQTPFSLAIRFMIRFDDEHRRYLRRCRKWFRRKFSWKRPRPEPDGIRSLDGFGTTGGRNIDGHIELAITRPLDQHLPLPNEEADEDGFALDSECIVRIFEISTDADVIQANMKFIPEIFWHPGIRKTPLERLYGAVLECFDRSTGRPVVIPKVRNQAYLGAKALLHLAIQRQCFGDGSDDPAFRSISNRHQILGSEHYEQDSDLESTLSIVDHVFDKVEPIRWRNFAPTNSHLAWMAHTLLFRAWDSARKGDPLPDDIREFVGHTFEAAPLPPAPIIADCLLMVDLAFGRKVGIRDLFVIDKTKFFEDILKQPDGVGDKLNQHLGGLCEKLAEVFQDAGSSTIEIDSALDAMAVVASSIITIPVYVKGRELLHAVMNAPITLSYTTEKKWQVARCFMHGLCRWSDRYWTWIGDPQDVITFLGHHFDLATQGGENQDKPIMYALRTLAMTSDNVTIAALNCPDLAKPTFIRGVLHAFEKARPLVLRSDAFDFLGRISEKWFETSGPIMEPEQMGRLCADWASVVDSLVETDRVKKFALMVLFGMMNSPHWRPHIVGEKWKLLEWSTSVPDDFEPLKRCIDNPEVTDVILQVGDADGVAAWLKILWLRYGKLVPEVQEKLEAASKKIAQTRRSALDVYLSAVDSELRKAKDASEEDDTDSTTGAKIVNLRQAKDALLAIKGG